MNPSCHSFRFVVYQLVNLPFHHLEDSLNWSDDLMYFVDHLLSNQESYMQCVCLGNGLYLPGPRKVYDVSDEEKRILAASGISTSSQYAWSFKHCIVQGVVFAFVFITRLPLTKLIHFRLGLTFHLQTFWTIYRAIASSPPARGAFTLL